MVFNKKHPEYHELSVYVDHVISKIDTAIEKQKEISIKLSELSLNKKETKKKRKK